MADDITRQLASLTDLHRRGILNDDEFTAAKHRVLSPSDGWEIAPNHNGASGVDPDTAFEPTVDTSHLPAGWRSIPPQVEPSHLPHQREPRQATPEPDSPPIDSRARARDVIKNSLFHSLWIAPVAGLLAGGFAFAYFGVTDPSGQSDGWAFVTWVVVGTVVAALVCGARVLLKSRGGMREAMAGMALVAILWSTAGITWLSTLDGGMPWSVETAHEEETDTSDHGTDESASEDVADEPASEDVADEPASEDVADAGTSEESPAPQPSEEPKPEFGSDRVGRNDLGEDWPLEVESGILVCERAGGRVSVTFLSDANDVEYALNGVAADRGFPAIGPIWADDPHIDGLKIPIGPLLTKGLDLCS